MSSAFIIDSDFYTAPTSHRLWHAPEADFPPSYFGLRRPPTIAQKTNSATRRGRNAVAERRPPAVTSEGGATFNSQQSTLNSSHCSPIRLRVARIRRGESQITDHDTRPLFSFFCPFYFFAL